MAFLCTGSGSVVRSTHRQRRREDLAAREHRGELGDADRLAEILGRLTTHAANELINGLNGGCPYGDIGSASGPVDARSG